MTERPGGQSNTTDGVRSSVVGVLGGATMGADAYADFLGSEYLADYIPTGGGSVKVAVVGDARVEERFRHSLGRAAEANDCQLVSVSAESTKVHVIDQVYFAAARQLDWTSIATAIVRTAYDDIAVPAPPGTLKVSQVAKHHDLDSKELYRSVRRQLEHALLSDVGFPRELRRALLRLAQVELGTGDVRPAEAKVVRDWLKGQPVTVRELREAMIYARIARHSARSMLTALGRLAQLTGRGGLVLYLDLSRLAESRRPPLPERNGLYYTKAAVLDAYELLRQLIDATDDLTGMLVVAALPPELISDDRRGLPTYAALQLRVADEVRDRRRANPFASLVRLDVRLEAVR